MKNVCMENAWPIAAARVMRPVLPNLCICYDIYSYPYDIYDIYDNTGAVTNIHIKNIQYPIVLTIPYANNDTPN